MRNRSTPPRIHNQKTMVNNMQECGSSQKTVARLPKSSWGPIVVWTLIQAVSDQTPRARRETINQMRETSNHMSATDKCSVRKA